MHEIKYCIPHQESVHVLISIHKDRNGASFHVKAGHETLICYGPFAETPPPDDKDEDEWAKIFETDPAEEEQEADYSE